MLNLCLSFVISQHERATVDRLIQWLSDFKTSGCINLRTGDRGGLSSACLWALISCSHAMPLSLPYSVITLGVACHSQRTRRPTQTLQSDELACGVIYLLACGHKGCLFRETETSERHMKDKLHLERSSHMCACMSMCARAIIDNVQGRALRC